LCSVAHQPKEIILHDNITELASMDDDALGMHLVETMTHVGSSAEVHGHTLSRQLAEADNTIPLGGLPEDMRGRINAQLQNTHPSLIPQRTRELIRQELEANSLSMKVRNGVSKDANALQKEFYGIQRELYDLDRDIVKTMEALHEVSRYEADGSPVYAVPGPRRAQMEADLQQLKGTREALSGRRGHERLDAAKARTIADIRETAAKIAEAKEIDRLVDEKVTQDRINAAVERKARMRKNAL
jgi:hypothetical protein